MAVTSTEIISAFASRSAVKDADQFLLGIIGTGNTLTLAKVGADIVKAYLRGDISLTDVKGTLDGEEATLEAIIADIRNRLTTMVDRATFNTYSALLDSLLIHSGLRHFDGFVDGVTVIKSAGTGFDTDDFPVYYHKTEKCFCAKKNGVYYSNFTGPSSGNYEGRADEYQEIRYEGGVWVVTPWPLRVFKNDVTGTSYMWDGTDLVSLKEGTKVVNPIDGILILPDAVIKSLAPNVLNRVSRPRTSITVQSLEAPRSGEVGDYMLEFIVSGDSFTLSFPNDRIRWVDGEEPEWEDGYTYQVSIEDGLAVAAGWPS